jgi:hypothetical protein
VVCEISKALTAIFVAACLVLSGCSHIPNVKGTYINCDALLEGQMLSLDKGKATLKMYADDKSLPITYIGTYTVSRDAVEVLFGSSVNQSGLWPVEATTIAIDPPVKVIWSVSKEKGEYALLASNLDAVPASFKLSSKHSINTEIRQRYRKCKELK